MQDVPTIVRILQTVPLLAKLPETKLIKLVGAMHMQSFAEGAAIYRVDEDSSRFYLLNKGLVRVVSNMDEELVRVNAPDFFGQRALTANEERKHNVIACGLGAGAEFLPITAGSTYLLFTNQVDKSVTFIDVRNGSQRIQAVQLLQQEDISSGCDVEQIHFSQ